MIRRHGAYRAAVTVTAALLILGMGSRPRDVVWPHEDTCKTDLPGVFESAAAVCKGVDEEYRDACEASFVRDLCPEEVTCTALDPIWCAPCTDTHGASFWSNMDGAGARCQGKLGSDMREVDLVAFAACFDEDVQRHCPALTGTGWFAWWRNKFWWNRSKGR